MHFSKSSIIAAAALTSTQVAAYPALNLNSELQGLSSLSGLIEAILVPVAVISPDAIDIAEKVMNPLSQPVTTYDECSELVVGPTLPGNCKTCVGKTACVWNKIDNVCMKKPQKLADKHVTSETVCQKLFDDSPEGKVQIAWTKMKPHVFGTEPSQEAWSGRHTLRALRAGKGLSHYPGVCDSTADLCIFAQPVSGAPKTVFGNSYTDTDVERICKDAIRTNKSSKTSAYVVNGLGGRRICVQHQVEGSGSCYPLGVNVSTGNLGEGCAGTGDEPTTEVVAPFA